MENLRETDLENALQLPNRDNIQEKRGHCHNCRLTRLSNRENIVRDTLHWIGATQSSLESEEVASKMAVILKFRFQYVFRLLFNSLSLSVFPFSFSFSFSFFFFYNYSLPDY